MGRVVFGSHVGLLCSRYWLSVRHVVERSEDFRWQTLLAGNFLFSSPFFSSILLATTRFSFSFMMIFELIIVIGVVNGDDAQSWWILIRLRFNLFNKRCNSHSIKCFTIRSVSFTIIRRFSVFFCNEFYPLYRTAEWCILWNPFTGAMRVATKWHFVVFCSLKGKLMISNRTL